MRNNTKQQHLVQKRSHMQNNTKTTTFGVKKVTHTKQH